MWINVEALSAYVGRDMSDVPSVQEFPKTEDEPLERLFDELFSGQFRSAIAWANSSKIAERLCQDHPLVHQLIVHLTALPAQQAALVRIQRIQATPIDEAYCSPYDEGLLALLVALRAVDSTLLTTAAEQIYLTKRTHFARALAERILRSAMKPFDVWPG